MPNRKVHTVVGCGAGGTAAYLLASDQEPAHQLLEVIGGVLAGGWGGRLPDILEPAIHPRHRSVAHALGPANAAGSIVVPRLRAGQNHTRGWAEQCRSHREGTSNLIEQILWWLAEMGCRLAAGAMGGSVAGYVSHLLMDATTPMGLPLIA